MPRSQILRGTEMKQGKLPSGRNEQRIQEVLEYHEIQPQDEAVAEYEAANTIGME